VIIIAFDDYNDTIITERRALLHIVQKYLLLKMSDTFYTKSDDYVTFGLFDKTNSSLIAKT